MGLLAPDVAEVRHSRVFPGPIYRVKQGITSFRCGSSLIRASASENPIPMLRSPGDPVVSPAGERLPSREIRLAADADRASGVPADFDRAKSIDFVLRPRLLPSSMIAFSASSWGRVFDSAARKLCHIGFRF